MIQIRKNTFETNSSSTHSLIMCDDSEYKALVNEKAFISGSYGFLEEIVPKDKLLKWVSDSYYAEDWHRYCLEHNLDEDSVNDLVDAIKCNFNDEVRLDIHTLEQVLDNYSYETFESSYTTKEGITVHAFGTYGHD